MLFFLTFLECQTIKFLELEYISSNKIDKIIQFIRSNSTNLFLLKFNWKWN